MQGDQVSQLIQSLESLYFSIQGSSKTLPSSRPVPVSVPVPVPVPTAEECFTTIQLYQTGLVLFEHPQDDSLMQSFQQFIRSIPYLHLSQVLLKELTQAYTIVVTSNKIDQIGTASHALAGLYCNSPLICQAGHSTTLIHALGLAYTAISDHFHIVQMLAAILIDGILSDNNDEEDNDDEDQQRLANTMEAIQILNDHDSMILKDLQQLHLQSSRTPTLLSKIETSIPPSVQRDYLQMMLTTANNYKTPPQPPPSIPNKKPPQIQKSPIIDPRDEILRRITQVKLLLPHLGDGYIEAALSCFQFDVSQTMAALMDEDMTTLPPTLQRLDPTLPARAKEATPSTYATKMDQDDKQIAKDRFKKMQQQEEEEAYALSVMMTKSNEYDDDYDDQYDDFDGGVGVGDGGGLDVDLDTVLMYNKVARETERESSFWNESRNTNREQRVSHANKTDNDSEDNGKKKYHGVDKIKGGRPIGPDGKVLPWQTTQVQGGAQAGNTDATASKQVTTAKKDEVKQGVKGNATKPSSSSDAATNGPTELTRLQKRHKMLNKAKAGNHHRKEGAIRKTGGMG